MKKKNTKFILLTAVTMLAALVQGCTGQSAEKPGEAATAAKINTDPVTLTFYGNMSEELFQKLVVAPVKLKYPNIDLTLVPMTNKIEDLIASGEVPDILGDNISAIAKYENLDLLEDLTPYVKAFNLDLSAVDPVVVDTVRKNSGEGKLYALPVSANVVTLYYNKDIFDRFGVPYPQDGMTWDQVYELAKKVTRTDGGVAYRGYDFQDLFQIQYNQLSVPVIDEKTNKAIVNNAEWKKLFENWARFYTITGNEVDAAGYGKGLNAFSKDKTLAMYSTSSFFSSMPEAVKNGLNYDVVSLPSFPEAPNTGVQVEGGARMITTTSKHKDQAFMALSAMLTPEAQKVIARNGNASVLTDTSINKDFGLDIEVLKGKNREAFIKNKNAKPFPSITKYDGAAFTIMRQQFKKVATGQEDVNTALREAEELINKAIEDQNKQQ
ncbi:extracellular solute-binding protein [Paenibacillus doosanensis]|uniref:ABC transporter substrate-binding protein n=1 Tax=Paenibacillus doosanensis TaxID=1229154 RepID=UPI002180279A|nr:extracellular solute-binding protein [Paenibacillus doosanensis]MCS7463408.1 extracellular solute-binding protein [Paenibacillus doosanensis]